MKKKTIFSNSLKRFLCSFTLLFLPLLGGSGWGSLSAADGWPSQYKGVMLQAFYWDSFEDTQWYTLEKQANDLATSFDLIWIPQSGNCGGTSMGYDDLWWFNNYDSSFGSEKQLRSMINAFKDKGLGTIADVVINHRRNLSNWVDFPKETYNGETYEMLSTDICVDDDGGDTKKWADANGYSLSSNRDTGEGWGGMRDLDHKSENVQRIVKAYLKFLLDNLGYAGFRYDMVKGYKGEYTKLYNEDSKPNFSVGECWDSSTTIQKWIDATEKTCAAFDFQFKYVVRNATDRQDWSYLNKQNDGNWPLVSSNFQSGNYRQYAVTFVENHDTEVRRDGSSNGPLRKDTLAANAFLLAMPGTPCVFLKHWQAYKSEIKAMIEARKLAGITNTSTYARYSSPNITTYFANTIDDKLLVVVGNTSKLTPEADKWTKILSGHHYAYYLANSLETAWADKGSGDFTDPFYVKLTAVSAKGNVKLVYTIDGSEPSASNGTQVATGTSIKIEKSTTLKVALLDGSTVHGIITRVFTYKEPEQEPEIEVPDFCTRTEDEICAFFEAPSTWTYQIYTWAWMNGGKGEDYLGTNWPGISATLIGTANNGNRVFKWISTNTTAPNMIIFSNNGSPQTANLSFINGGYYNVNGFQAQVATGIENVTLEPSSECEESAAIYNLRGQKVGTSSLKNLPKGIYIVRGQKVVIR